MFWRPVEVAQIKTTHSLRVVVNAYGCNLSLLSSSYQLQCRYASRMCLVERIFAYIQSGFARTKPRVIAIVLFSRIKSFPRNLCSRSSKNSSSVSKLETPSSKLDSRSSKLDSRNSSLETRFSILENFEDR